MGLAMAGACAKHSYAIGPRHKVNSPPHLNTSPDIKLRKKIDTA